MLLVGLAGIVAFIDPIVIEYRPRLELTVAVLAAGLGALAFGYTRNRPAARWAGTAILWAGIIAGILSQIAALGTAPGAVWGPRGMLLLVAVLGWMLFLDLPAWIWRGALAAALPTLAVCAWLWNTAPPVLLSANNFWVAVNSQGTVYGADIERGLIWVFAPDGHVRGKIWPAYAPKAGTPGPGHGIQPAGINQMMLVNLTPGPNLPPVPPEFFLCGLATDLQDRLYVVDLAQSRLLQLDAEGRLVSTWPLPDSYLPASTCVATDATRVYLADRRGFNTLNDQAGTQQAQRPLEDGPRGMTTLPGDRLAILGQKSIEIRQVPEGTVVQTLALPGVEGSIQTPYQSIAGTPGGDLLISHIAQDQDVIELLRYRSDGTPLGPLGQKGGLPGQFSGLGGIAVDRAGRIYVTDFAQRLIQRFSPDGQIEAVWSARQDEIGETE
jgi:hypothetical protein